MDCEAASASWEALMLAGTELNTLLPLPSTLGFMTSTWSTWIGAVLEKKFTGQI